MPCARTSKIDLIRCKVLQVRRRRSGGLNSYVYRSYCHSDARASMLQGAAEIRGVVVDISGAPVPDAKVIAVVSGQEQPVPLAADGSFTLTTRSGELRVTAPGFAEVTV